jgi:hypothetical protein
MDKSAFFKLRPEKRPYPRKRGTAEGIASMTAVGIVAFSVFIQRFAAESTEGRLRRLNDRRLFLGSRSRRDDGSDRRR